MLIRLYKIVKFFDTVIIVTKLWLNNQLNIKVFCHSNHKAQLMISARYFSHYCQKEIVSIYQIKVERVSLSFD